MDADFVRLLITTAWLLIACQAQTPPVFAPDDGSCSFNQMRLHGDYCGGIDGYVRLCQRKCEAEFGAKLVHSYCRRRTNSRIFDLTQLNPHDCFCCHADENQRLFRHTTRQRTKTTSSSTTAPATTKPHRHLQKFPTAEEALHGASHLTEYTGASECVPVLNASEIACGLNNDCDGWLVAVKAPDIQVNIATGVPNERTLWSLFGGDEQPSENFLMIYGDHGVEATDQVLLSTCPIACSLSNIEVSLRHWQSYGVRLDICFLEFGPGSGNDLEVCSPLYRRRGKNPAPSVEFLPAAKNFVISIKAAGLEPGSVVLLDDLNVKFDACDLEEAYASLANLIEEETTTTPPTTTPLPTTDLQQSPTAFDGPQEVLEHNVCNGRRGFLECNKYCRKTLGRDFKGSVCYKPDLSLENEVCKCNPTEEDRSRTVRGFQSTGTTQALTTTREETTTLPTTLKTRANQLTCQGIDGLRQCGVQCLRVLGEGFQRARCEDHEDGSGLSCVCIEKPCFGQNGFHNCKQLCDERAALSPTPVSMRAHCGRTNKGGLECQCHQDSPLRARSIDDKTVVAHDDEHRRFAHEDGIVCQPGVFGRRTCSIQCLKIHGPRTQNADCVLSAEANNIHVCKCDLNQNQTEVQLNNELLKDLDGWLDNAQSGALHDNQGERQHKRRRHFTTQPGGVKVLNPSDNHREPVDSVSEAELCRNVQCNFEDNDSCGWLDLFNASPELKSDNNMAFATNRLGSERDGVPGPMEGKMYIGARLRAHQSIGLVSSWSQPRDYILQMGVFQNARDAPLQVCINSLNHCITVSEMAPVVIREDGWHVYNVLIPGHSRQVIVRAVNRNHKQAVIALDRIRLMRPAETDKPQDANESACP